MNNYNANQKADKAESLKKKVIKVFDKYVWPFLKMLLWYVFKEFMKNFFSKDES